MRPRHPLCWWEKLDRVLNLSFKVFYLRIIGSCNVPVSAPGNRRWGEPGLKFAAPRNTSLRRRANRFRLVFRPFSTVFQPLRAVLHNFRTVFPRFFQFFCIVAPWWGRGAVAVPPQEIFNASSPPAPVSGSAENVRVVKA